LDPRDFFGLDFSGAVIGGGLAKPPTQPLLPYMQCRRPQLGGPGFTSKHTNVDVLASFSRTMPGMVTAALSRTASCTWHPFCCCSLSKGSEGRENRSNRSKPERAWFPH